MMFKIGRCQCNGYDWDSETTEQLNAKSTDIVFPGPGTSCRVCGYIPWSIVKIGKYKLGKKIHLEYVGFFTNK